MVMAIHNNAQNATTKQVPSMVLMGFLPTLVPLTMHTLGVPAADNWVTRMIQAQKMAIDVIN